MKITVSYISSKYDYLTTIKLINETDADALHMDLMDGEYVSVKNFEIDKLQELLIDNTKKVDIHMMVKKPSMYLSRLFELNPNCIYIHPSTEVSLMPLLSECKMHEVKCGIAINPDESLDEFHHYYPYIDRILLMGVTPGAGGQKYIMNTTTKLKKLIEYKDKYNYNFEIYIDGGINDETIKYVSDADGVVSGSYVCNSDNFQERIDSLR